MSWKPVKVVTSHVGVGRLMAEMQDTSWVVARIPAIPSPYAFSAFWPVYLWKGRPVIVRETRHKHYEVFVVPQDLLQPASVADRLRTRRRV